MKDLPRVGVVVLAHGPEPLLQECLDAVLESTDVIVDLVVVDNECTSPLVGQLRDDPRVTLVEPGRNLGFTGGCNLGASRTDAPVLALVNSDAVVAPDALAELCAALSDESVGIASGLVVMHDDPTIVNSAGNPVHWSLLSWAGGSGEPVSLHEVACEVASCGGALMALRRPVWDLMGGFHEALFAYCEDSELSLRMWLSGRRVVYVPDAVARHRYEFTRNPTKLYLLERNRLINLLTVPERRTLWSLAPGLLLVEVGIALASVRGGWFAEKRAGWAWLLRHRGEVASRRLLVQSGRRRHDDVLLDLLADGITPGAGTDVSVPRALNAILAVQARVARWTVRRGRGGPGSP